MLLLAVALPSAKGRRVILLVIAVLEVLVLMAVEFLMNILCGLGPLLGRGGGELRGDM